MISSPDFRVLIAASSLVLPVSGQDVVHDVPAPSGEEEELVLDEITVSASKLDETIFENMASLGKVDQKRIVDYNLREVNDAYRMLGNVSSPQFVDGGFVIRGINSEAPDAENISGNQTPLSTLFVDGVALTQQGTRRGPAGLWDVASVEVLRGPQSTLQGKNSLAGAVHIRTNDPSLERASGATRLTLGEYNMREWAAMLNLPLNEEFAIRFTAEHAEMDSFVRYPNLRNFKRYDDFSTSESLQLRAKALYQSATLPLTSRLTYSFSENSPALSDVNGPNSDPSVDSYFDYVWLSASFAQQIREARNHTAAWENEYELSDTLRLTALSTFTRTELNVGQIDGGFIRDDTELEFTQELRLNWNAAWGKAVAGIYGSRSEGESTQNLLEKRRTNAAIFGEVDYIVHGGLHAIAGGRLDHDDFRISSAGLPTSTSSDLEFLPKVGMRYDFSDTHTLGYTLQRGYQSGGAGTDLGQTYTFDPSFTWHHELAYRKSFMDDRLTVAANAFHSKWKDQQVVLRNFDLTSFSVSERVINASDSTLSGGEIEILFKATDRLSFFGSIGLLRTRYEDFTYSIDPAVAAALGVPDTLDYRGYEFPEAPSINFGLGVDYRHENGVFFTADAAYTGSYYSPVLFAPISSGPGGVSVQVPQDSVVEVDPSVTVNVSLGYERENWKFTLFVRNLFGEEQVIGKIPRIVNTPGGITYQGNYLATVGAPRFIGGSVEFKF